MSGYKAMTPKEKFANAKCKNCSHYWLRENYEMCTNPKMKPYYGKKKKIGSMMSCVDYDEV